VKSLQLRQCIVTIPDNDVASAVVLYGGLMGWEGQWFLNHRKIPSVFLERLYFILPTHFTNSCGECLREFRSKVKHNIAQLSLCGFSRGAQEVYRNQRLEKWHILGLIDPSAPTLDIFHDDVVDKAASKIRCVYWVPNWGKHGYGGRVPRFAQHLRDLKVQMVEKSVTHADMPPFFFNQFGFDL